MKHNTSAVSRQRGFVSGKFMFFCIIVSIGIMVKMNPSTEAKVSGKSVTTLQAEMGVPVSKEQIARPS